MASLVSAPLGNTNAVKHGLTASRHSLVLGNMPQSLKKVERLACAFRRELEAAVVAEKGHITLLDAARIQTATRLETTCMLARRWLLEALADLREAERLAYLREINRASVERDRTLRALGLDSHGVETADALYEAMPPLDDANDEPGDDDEPQVIDADHAGGDEATDDDVCSGAGAVRLEELPVKTSDDDAARDDRFRPAESQPIANQ